MPPVSATALIEGAPFHCPNPRCRWEQRQVYPPLASAIGWEGYAPQRHVCENRKCGQVLLALFYLVHSAEQFTIRREGVYHLEGREEVHARRALLQCPKLRPQVDGADDHLQFILARMKLCGWTSPPPPAAAPLPTRTLRRAS